MNDDARLAAALRNLPGCTPAHDGWPLLAARVKRRQRLRHALHIAVPAALAASLVLAVLPSLRLPAAPATPLVSATRAQPAMASDAARLTALRARSQRLQAWIGELHASGAPLDGHALARAADLEDLIGLVDLQLGSARATDVQLPLWQQRVRLLQQLAMLRLVNGNSSERAASSDSAAPHSRIWID